MNEETEQEWSPRFENQAKRIATLFFPMSDHRNRFLWEMIARELQRTHDERCAEGPEG
jgi:hypothetical protein